MNKARDLSFTPGAGHPPPVLAGRDEEKAAIRMALDRLKAGLSPAQNIALIGPRGNGKTVLLRWVEAQIGRCNGNIKCEVLHPDCFESHRDLVGALADQSVLSALAGEGFSANISLLGSGVGFSRQDAAKKLLGPVLKKKVLQEWFGDTDRRGAYAASLPGFGPGFLQQRANAFRQWKAVAADPCRHPGHYATLERD